MKSFRGLRVLVVEDDIHLREALAEDFESVGAHVEAADSGEAAWAILQKSDFDVVFSDMRMPNGDGRFLVNMIGQHLKKKPHFFLYSGFNDVSRAEAQEWGVTAVLNKPMRSKDIFVSILKYL